MILLVWVLKFCLGCESIKGFAFFVNLVTLVVKIAFSLHSLSHFLVTLVVKNVVVA